MKYIFFVLLAVAIFFTYCSKGGNNNSTTVHVNCDSLINDPLGSSNDSASITIPNVFTPNGDGINDVLFINYYQAYLTKLTIFDENNNVVFVTTAPKYWNASDSTAYPSNTTYYYRLQAKSTTGQNIGKCGTLLLLRHCIPSNISLSSLNFTYPNDPVTFHTCP